ncbi:MAG TPA: hypothetical protein VHO29_03710 [Marmoricola sp.]|nr:hypothetical protein [Marmoricola sp.]
MSTTRSTREVLESHLSSRRRHDLETDLQTNYDSTSSCSPRRARTAGTPLSG